MQNVGGTKLNETGIRHGFCPQGACGGVRGIKLYTASGLNGIKWDKGVWGGEVPSNGTLGKKGLIMHEITFDLILKE